MRKRVLGKKLNRNRRSRAALFRSQARAMILHGSIKTTKAKAVAVSGMLSRLMGLVSDGSLASRRRAMSILANDREAVEMLFDKYKSLASGRKSGFTTLSLLPPRRGDAARMAELSWVEFESDKAKDVSGKKKTK